MDNAAPILIGGGVFLITGWALLRNYGINNSLPNLSPLESPNAQVEDLPAPNFFEKFVDSIASLTASGRLNDKETLALANKIVARHYQGIDPIMILTMAKIESSLDPLAERFEPHINDSSIGLMQTLLGTATWLYNDIGARAYGAPTKESLQRPEVSIYFGAAYINWLSTWRGQAQSENWIVESYNGGPGNSNSQTRNHLSKYIKTKQQIIKGGL